MTDKNYGVWKMQDWKMTDKLAGTRVSVLSVLTLWPLCQMAVRCVVHLLTWLCVCIFDRRRDLIGCSETRTVGARSVRAL